MCCNLPNIKHLWKLLCKTTSNLFHNIYSLLSHTSSLKALFAFFRLVDVVICQAFVRLNYLLSSVIQIWLAKIMSKQGCLWPSWRDANNFCSFILYQSFLLKNFCNRKLLLQVIQIIFCLFSFYGLQEWKLLMHILQKLNSQEN